MARGITAVQLESQPIENAEESASKYPCYIGQAPIWQVDNEKWQDLAGKTFIVKSLEQMRAMAGHYKPEKGSWKKEFSLCAAAEYHFAVEKVGPIILLINKTAVMQGGEETETVTFNDGVAVIKSPYIVLNSVAIEGKVKGTDYTAEYDKNGRNIVVSALTGMETAEIKYKSVNHSDMAFSADTFEELDFFEQTIGTVPETLSAPLWDKEKTAQSMTVGESLTEKVQNPLNGHWYSQAVIQICGETKAEAIKDKQKYNNYKAKACWPCVKKDGLIYPLSIAFLAAKEKVDSKNGGIPYESASNEMLGINGLCTESGGVVRMKEADANALNEIGIATANFTGMQWVTWGVCMSDYAEKARGEIAPDRLSDVAVQMKDFVSNKFQERYAKLIDKPMQTRQTMDIVTDFQMFLDTLTNAGQLVFGEIQFLENKNSTASLADGTFTFSIAETNTPPGKAIIGEVAYSSEALTNYFEGGENE